MNEIKVLDNNDEIVSCRGYVRVKDINKSDEIRDSDGNYHKIVNVSEGSYEGEIVKVKVNGYFPFMSLLPDNQVFVYRGSKEERSWDMTRWVPASEISVGDMVVYNVHGGGFCGDFLNGWGEYPYPSLVGYYLLEGFCDKRTVDRVVFREESTVSGLVDELKNICRDIYKDNYTEHGFAGEDYFTVIDAKLYEFLSLFGKGNRERVIPEGVINSDKAFLKSMIDSFLKMDKDSRGSYFRPSSSLDLFRGYQRLLMRYNAFSNVYDCVSKNGKFNYYAIVLNEVEKKEVEMGLEGGQYTQDRWFKEGDYVYLKVVEVTKDVLAKGRACTFSTEGSSVVNHIMSYK